MKEQELKKEIENTEEIKNSEEVENDKFMRLALEEARKAENMDEVPIGAVIVKNGEVIGSGYNRRETDKNPLAHAEIMAISEAAKTLGGWRLLGCTLYVTLEPCPMCTGAIIQSRIERLVYGAKDSKGGACDSKVKLISDFSWNHKVEVTSGVLENECSCILKEYFRGKRSS